MGFLQNTWLRYYDRSYQQIKEQVITNLQSRVPEITDHTESNVFIKMLSIWAAIAEMLGYYIDNIGREAHLDSARLYSSGISHARKADYRVRGQQPGVVTLTLSIADAIATNIVLTAGIIVRQGFDGVFFITVTNGTIQAGQTEVEVTAKQLVDAVAVALGSSNGEPNQEIIVGGDVADSTVILKVNNILWTRVETLGYSLPGDLHYMETVNKNRVQVLLFGDGVNGKIPTSGASFVADYKKTEGEAGNLEELRIDTMVSTPVVPSGVTLKVINKNRVTMGSDVETLDQLKRRIPLHNRTMERAVSRQDYIDVTELAPGVIKAGLDFSCGKTIDLFIVPDGGGLANQVLLDATKAFMRTKKMVTTETRFFPAGEVNVKLSIKVTALPTYTNTFVKNKVIANLIDLISYKNQEVSGTLHLGDIYQTVENSDGVRNSKVVAMTTVPYARPLDENIPQLNWSREIKITANPLTSVYQIIFIEVGKFQLLKNNGFLGEFNVNTLVTTEDLTFTVNGNYVVGQAWEFYAYPYFGSEIALQEPSIPVAYANDLDIQVIGGL